MVSFRLLLAALALLVVAPVGAPVVAAAPPAPAGLAQCQAPAAGSFVVLGSGQHRGEPTALLMQERWFPDGRIEGVRYSREGRRFSEDRYTGRVRPDAACWALVERQGRPRVSLVLAPTEVLSLRYVSQAPGSCSPALLDGLVTSQQQGQSWADGRWQANAVVQREWWQAGEVRGLAVMNYAGNPDRVTYSGRLQLGNNCLGRMTQRDSKGIYYNYRVVVLAKGGGYIYLQTDPDDLTLGLLQHQR